MNLRLPSTSRGVFATPGSRSFSKTPSLGSGIQKTPTSLGHSDVNMIDINRQSVSCEQNDDQRGKSEANLGIENKILRTPRDEFNVNKRSAMNSQGFASKKRSVIYTTPDEGNESRNSSFNGNLNLTTSSQSASGLLNFYFIYQILVLVNNAWITLAYILAFLVESSPHLDRSKKIACVFFFLFNSSDSFIKKIYLEVFVIFPNETKINYNNNYYYYYYYYYCEYFERTYISVLIKTAIDMCPFKPNK